jgi:DNA (cytosine-5)-methyltransferase 1
LFVPISFHHNAQASQLPSDGRDTSVSEPLTCSQQAAVSMGLQVRRLTPVECERLQGFPDGYTAIPWRGRPASECPDGPRYKALGNSMAVPVMSWIGRRINAIETKEGL